MHSNRPDPTFSSLGFVKVLLVGLLVAQAVATLHVRQSNLSLFAKMQAVIGAGYLAVPNGKALASLKAIGPAVWGGLFFTLSTGAILTLLSLAASRLNCGASGKGAGSRYVPLLVWALLVILINLSGFDFFVNLYFLLIPPVVFFCSRRWWRPGGQWGHTAFLTAPVIILAALWFTQYDRAMFIDIRDRLLLSNPVGEEVNQFYYRYTLYPAEAFKAPSQKSINTSQIDGSVGKLHRRPIIDMLTRLDWLPVQSGEKPDLVIGRNRDRLQLVHAGRAIEESSVEELTSKPRQVLEQFSNEIDRHGLFRSICFYGLLLGFPVVLYIILFTLARGLCSLFFSPNRSLVAASAICLLLGIMAWGYFQYGRAEPKALQDPIQSLASQNWRVQVAALRQFRGKKLDVKQMPQYETLKASSSIPVRYWLVEALSASRTPSAYQDLIYFLNDHSLNVRTRACEALGIRGNQRAIPVLIDRLQRSDEWYFQWYAYKAMKALGWNQNASE